MTTPSTPPPPERAKRRFTGQLVATGVDKAWGDHTVLQGITLRAHAGRRIGVIGDNGAGKSTLLKLLAGVERPDSGDIIRPDDTALLEQELRLPPATTIHEVIETALAELRDVTARVAQLAELVQANPGDALLAREYGNELEDAQAREAWDADHRVDRVVRGLGLIRYERSREIGSLSGGERARVAMAALLVRQPRALLLDEPTNHLDDAGLAFVQKHLCGLPGIVLLTSHDRTFLDEVCTDIFDLDPMRGTPTRYGGTFSNYLAVQEAERRRWRRDYERQQAELTSLKGRQESMDGQPDDHRGRRDNDKLGYNNAGESAERAAARRVRRAGRRIGAIEQQLIPRPPDPLHFEGRIGAPVEEGDELLAAVRELVVRWPSGAVVGPVELDVDIADRLLITGENGSGKSTILRVLAGRIEHTSGDVFRRPVLRVGLLDQDASFDDLSLSPREVYRETLGHERAAELPLSHLGLLHVRDLDRPVGVLSEGQRRRIALALLVADAPQLLLLDEPTNHLSPLLVSELEDAFDAAPCGIVIASHDRWLRTRWSGRELRMAPRGGTAALE